MKTEKLTYALIATALLALGWLISGIRFTINPAVLLGFGAVGTILAIGAIDYGSTRIKRVEIK